MPDACSRQRMRCRCCFRNRLESEFKENMDAYTSFPPKASPRTSGANRPSLRSSYPVKSQYRPLIRAVHFELGEIRDQRVSPLGAPRNVS